ncbi:MAG: helix-turn-helix domain-containing protein [Thermoguttaceae bacterium]|jgi:excisionase family DNA binding protein
MKSFKTFLNKQIKYLDGLEANWAQLDAPWETTEYMIQETADRAAKLGLADLYKKSLNLKGTFSDCKWYLAECRQATKGTDYLSVTEAARLMQVNRDNVLSLINTGRLRATNTSRGYRPRYRIARADLEAMGRVKEVGKKTHKNKSTITDHFPAF